MSDGLSGLCLVPVAVGAFYLYWLAAASMRGAPAPRPARAATRFAVAIPAFNEEAVIRETVTRLAQQDYPRGLFDLYVGADHCSDATAEQARAAGATCWERSDGDRHGKGAVLAWMYERIFRLDVNYDAVVVFDADTFVDRAFLRAMDAHIASGASAVQGQHRIRNPHDSRFALLTWAMFTVDNRFQNAGRASLGWSAKNMGDSICYGVPLLRQYQWGQGLTEDYQFRQRLLLDGIRIAYEPGAIGEGEAPLSWAAARRQRERWLSGTYRASRQYAWRLLREGLRRRDGALLDGAAQALLPSYSTLTLVAATALGAHLLFGANFAPWLGAAWALVLGALMLYPLLGLALERAPLRAYAVVLLGPLFVVWRTALSVHARFGKPVEWVRTRRRNEALPPVGHDSAGTHGT